MKYTVKKDITLAEESYIVHGCNAQGAMGSGVARAIRQKWPHVYEDYRDYITYCRELNIAPLGKSITSIVDDNRRVGHLITQEFYGNDGKRYASTQALDAALHDFCFSQELHIENKAAIAIPPICTGLGGLTWNEVRPILLKAETVFGVEFNVYDFDTSISPADY